MTDANPSQHQANVDMLLRETRTGITQSSRRNDNLKRNPSDSKRPEWRVSATCDGGACVMVARHGDFIVLGNSAQPSGPLCEYTSAEWREFLAGVKFGYFDDLF